MYNYFNASGGDFSLCLYEPELAVNNECRQAIPLSVRTSCQAETFSNMFVTGDLVSEPSCGYYKGGDVWFTAIMPPTGIMRISKERIGGATHPALAIYSGTCGSLTEEFCSRNESETTFSNQAMAGKLVYLRIFSFNSEEGSRFSLCLYEQDAPSNDLCAGAIPAARNKYLPAN